MTEVLGSIVSWKTFGFALLVFGLAPGLVLRLVVLCYPKNDPRRRELIADLYVMRHSLRPLWVCTQIETALFEGLAARWEQRRRRSEAFAKWLAATAIASVVSSIVVLTFFLLSFLPFTGTVCAILVVVGLSLASVNRGRRHGLRSTARRRGNSSRY